MAADAAALAAVLVLAGAFLAIFGSPYLGAVASQKRGKLDESAVRILRWAVAGQMCLYLLALTELFVVPPMP